MKHLVFMLILSLISCQENVTVQQVQESSVKYDSHVHLMSPELIETWKDIGIPFARPEAYYSNIDTILHYNNALHIDLIGMGYVYGNPEYYQGTDAHERMMSENDYLLSVASKYSDRITPFFAVDPLKDYALEELNRCYQLNPKTGLKLHFSASQVYLTEPEHLNKIYPVFQMAAEKNLPILLHFDNWHPKFGKPDLMLFADSILQKIPAIDLRIAHFGTSGGFNEKTKKFIDAFLALKAANRFPARHNIKFDISAVALDKDSDGVTKLSSDEFEVLKVYINKIGIDNILFGTDYPLYTSTKYLSVLKNKLALTDEELHIITSLQKR